MREWFASLVLCCTVWGSWGAGCHGKPEFGVQNTLPIITDPPTFLRQYVNGTTTGKAKLYEAGGANDRYYVVHLWGTPYDMGYAEGTIIQKEAVALLDGVWQYLLDQIEPVLKDLPQWLRTLIATYGLDIALDMTWDLTRHWVGKYFVEEMQGMADASGASYLKIRRIHLLGALTQGKCSMYGVWGDAIKEVDSELLQLRALDWDVDGPFKDHPAVIVYHPDKGNGHAFANVGWTGWMGSITGMSSVQTAISEIGIAYPGDEYKGESRVGYPFSFLLRDVLQFDETIDAALHRIGTTTRTCDLLLGVGDGKKTPKSDAFRGMAVDEKTFDVFDDQNLRPLLNGSHPRIPNVVYWGMDWECPAYNDVLATQLKKHYGAISPENTILDILPIVKTGDLHIAIYDLTNQFMYIANARKSSVTEGKPMAYDRSFTKMDMKALFAEAPPTV